VLLLVGCALLAAGCTVGGGRGGRAHAAGSPQIEETRRRARCLLTYEWAAD
jgi:hypothetical protein